MADPPWRLITGDDGLPSILDGPGNMAADHALLEQVQAGGSPVVRLYRWDPPTLSFGRNQPAAGLYDDDSARALGIRFVRRPTGGQAVLHDDELTYAVVAPVDVLGRPRAAYGRINRALVAGLRLLGIDACSGPAATGPVDWAAACFRAPAEGEVVAGGRKLVGSAQRTERRVILQHGSILVGGSQAAAEELLVERRPVAEVAWTTVEQELGRRPGWKALAESVAAGFMSELGTSLAPTALPREAAEAASRLREHYASAEWTWRR